MLNYRPQQNGYGEQHALPGGGVEKNENIVDALHRESVEEIGCKIKNIEKIGYTIELGQSKSPIQKTCYFIGNVDGDKIFLKTKF